MSRGSIAAVAVALVLGGTATCARADAWAPTGDAALRHDLQVLADAGVFRLPTSTWPIPWADIAGEIERTANLRLGGPAAAALSRVQARLGQAADAGTRAEVSVAAAENPRQLRGFADTPREEGEFGLGLTWQSDRLSLRLAATGVVDASDGQDVRADGSYLAGLLGNVLVSAGYVDKWWGPGHDGSLILSNNARPMPGITIERARSTPFETPWLAWIGPWRAVMTVAQFEGSRSDAPEAKFFGLRVAAKPLPQLELAASRSAQLCGEGRPCSASTWWDMFVGNDNAGAALPRDREPGNQLGGFDARWAFQSVPLALYAQAIGEDEAGFLPSKYLGLIGAEVWGGTAESSWRAYVEYADTACEFTRSDAAFGCAYENGIYTDGYTFRDRPLGHAADRDARLYSAGLVLLNGMGHWSARAVSGEFNRGGVAGLRPHAWSAQPADYLGVTAGWQGELEGFQVAIEAGWQRLEPEAGRKQSDAQLALRVGKQF